MGQSIIFTIHVKRVYNSRDAMTRHKAECMLVELGSPSRCKEVVKSMTQPRGKAAHFLNCCILYNTKCLLCLRAFGLI